MAERRSGLSRNRRPTPRGATRIPPDGGPPGTDLEFTRRQHLDPFNVQLGLINPPLPSQNFMNPDLGNAIGRALNDWQIESLVRPEPRLRASIVVNYEDPPAAVAEIERCAGTEGYGHVLLMSRTTRTARRAALCTDLRRCRGGEHSGRRCMRSGSPAIPPHRPAGRRSTSRTWSATRRASRRISPAWSSKACSSACPTCASCMIEGGFGWLPSLCLAARQAVEAGWRDETPHLKRLPSEYIREHVWLTTQPMEEPQQPRASRWT